MGSRLGAAVASRRSSVAEVQLRKSTPPAVGPIAPWLWPAKLATPPPRHRSEPRRRSAVTRPTSDIPQSQHLEYSESTSPASGHLNIWQDRCCVMISALQ